MFCFVVVISSFLPFSLTVHRQVHKQSLDSLQTVQGRTDKSIVGHSSEVDLTVCQLLYKNFLYISI